MIFTVIIVLTHYQRVTDKQRDRRTWRLSLSRDLISECDKNILKDINCAIVARELMRFYSFTSCLAL